MGEQTSTDLQPPYRVLICDFVGLKFGSDGQPDSSEVKRHIEESGGVFHDCSAAKLGRLDDHFVHFFYLPGINTESEFVAEAGDGFYDAVIVAATVVPERTVFRLGGVRIGAGTGNMRSRSWGGADGKGGSAPLMNTPGINSRATAHMVMKAILKVAPDLPVDFLHKLVVRGQFDTGRDLPKYPTEKLEGRRLVVLGYGNIGREVARLARAFSMRVCIYARASHRPWIEAEGFEFSDDPVQAARDADFVSVHIGLGRLDPSTSRFENAGLVGRELFRQLADNAVLINFDRGEVVDIAALDEAMKDGKIAFAAIDADIFKAEAGTLSGPMVPYRPLTKKYPRRLLLLPHAAADTDHPSRVAGAKQAVDQILGVIRHRQVVNLKGDLPPGFTHGTARSVRGINKVSGEDLASRMEGAILDELAQAAGKMSSFLAKMTNAEDHRAKLSIVQCEGETFMKKANVMVSMLQDLGLQGPFEF
jgi:lactate dehydrogenase-like 2-hydroxyacid dehydrogenase